MMRDGPLSGLYGENALVPCSESGNHLTSPIICKVLRKSTISKRMLIDFYVPTFERPDGCIDTRIQLLVPYGSKTLVHSFSFS